MASTIKLKNGSGAPLAGDLVQGEPALDLTNKRLYTENASGVVIEVGTNPSTIDINAGTIDGTVIGGSTAAAGTFTTGQFNTSLNVDGTVTADGLTVAKGSNGTYATLSGDDAGGARGLAFTSSSVSGSVGARHTLNALSALGEIALQTNSKDRLNISSGGDILFYEDTGTSPKMVWKSADERLGIGTSTPGAKLEALGNLRITNATDANSAIFQVTSDATGSNGVNLEATYYGSGGFGPIKFTTSNTERMRIDSSGNLLVGTTDDTVQTNSGTGNGGIVLRYNNYIAVASDGSAALELNRLASDGEIANFRKDGTTVGSIGASGGNIYIGQGDTTIMFSASSDAILPKGTDGADRDNAIDLGQAAVNRFNDAFITNGVTTGSDGNDKQDIEELTEAEQRVAVACKGLLRKWRWKDAVEEKGDEARIHFGIIAQDLQAAFEAEGLDAGRYAMFMSNNWTDKETGEERTRLGVRYHELLAFIIAAI